MQLGPVERRICVIPPYQLSIGRGILWELQKLPYGIVEAGRQWLKVSEKWLQNRAKMESVPSSVQVLMKRDTDGRVILLVSKTFDDFLISGTRVALEDFITELQDRLEVSKVENGDTQTYNGCKIKVSGGGSVTLDMVHYYERLSELALTRSRKRKMEREATTCEEKACRVLAGTFRYLGNSFLPQASLVTSLMQQRLGALRVAYLSKGNKIPNEIIDLSPTLIFMLVTRIKDVSGSDVVRRGTRQR